MPHPSQHYSAKWIFPVDVPPIENGTIEISDGRITSLEHYRHPNAEDFGNAAIIPGLVNAHTHLEFSDFSEPIGPRSPFTSWVRSVVACRAKKNSADPMEQQGTPTEQFVDPVKMGCRESIQAGSTFVGEIATRDSTWELDKSTSPRSVVFRELIGFRDDQLGEQLAIARRFLEDKDCESTRRVSRAISPHAPYSVHPELFEKLIGLAVEFDVPAAMHLAETRAELELLATGEGELGDMLREFGVWREDVLSPGMRPLDYLQRLAELRRALVIHGNYLSEEEIDFLAKNRHLTVVYCPRTHAYFGHDAHPWRELLQRGASVALGTDSRASNPDLSLWGEICYLQSRFPKVDPAVLLELGTIRAAEAMGLDSEIGSLTVGKSADLSVIRLAGDSGTKPYERLLLKTNTATATMIAGEWLYRADGKPGDASGSP